MIWNMQIRGYYICYNNEYLNITVPQNNKVHYSFTEDAAKASEFISIDIARKVQYDVAMFAGMKAIIQPHYSFEKV